MKFLVPNYSCPQNPRLGGYRPQIPCSLCPQLNLLNPPSSDPPGKTGRDHFPRSVTDSLAFYAIQSVYK